MPHPLGSSRSHPAPQELISCPACLPGWWTSRIGTRPCSGVGLSLEPGTSTSLLIRFNSCTRQKMLDVSATSKLIFALRNRDEKKNEYKRVLIYQIRHVYVSTITVMVTDICWMTFLLENDDPPALISCYRSHYPGQTAPTDSSDSNVQVLLATWAPSSSPRPPLKHTQSTHTHGMLLYNQHH